MIDDVGPVRPDNPNGERFPRGTLLQIGEVFHVEHIVTAILHVQLHCVRELSQFSVRQPCVAKDPIQMGLARPSHQSYLQGCPAAKGYAPNVRSRWQKTRGVARRARVLRSAKSASFRMTSPVGETGRECSFRRTNCKVRPSLSRLRAVHWDSISTRPSIRETAAGPSTRLAAPARFGQRSG